jgi:hypothetical protein
MLFTCPRCLQHFEEKGLLDDHAQSDFACTKATTPPPQDIEGCSQEQERKLRCRKRPPGETDEDRWAEMYRILFGDDCEVPGPCELTSTVFDNLQLIMFRLRFRPAHYLTKPK